MKVTTPTALLALALTVTLASCGSATETKTTAETTTAETAPAAAPAEGAAAAPAAAAAAVTIDASKWEMTDLGKVDAGTPMMLKLPKDAKKEKNPNGGIDVTLSDGYVISINEMGVSSIKEGKESLKSLTVDRKDQYINGKVLKDEPNGMVYTMETHYAGDNTKYEPEYHFAYYVEKNGGIYSIKDERPLANMDLPGSAYPEAVAMQVYDLIKGSAKLK